MTAGGQEQIGNIELVKQLNSAVVYRLIDRQGPISRIQIAELSQLAPASVTKITRQLLARGLIKEVEQQASTGGRRAISIVTETRFFHIVAIRLGRHDATVTLYEMSGNVIVEQDFSMPEQTQEALEQRLLDTIAQFITTYQGKIHELIAIAIILPGLVDFEQGIVRYMPHILVNQWPLVQVLESHFHLPSFIGHDILSLALAEHYFGTTRDCENSILIRLHRGVGAGIIANGAIFHSNHGNVGEIGHIQIDSLGERCHCGNFGCLETITASAAIEQRVRHLLTQGYPSQLTTDQCDIPAICQAANKGDQLAREVIEHTGRHLGRAIAIMINLFNPQKIVIAGEVTQADKILLPAIQHCVNTQALKNFRQHLPIITSKLDHHSAIGAFALAKRALLNGVLLQRLL